MTNSSYSTQHRHLWDCADHNLTINTWVSLIAMMQCSNVRGCPRLLQPALLTWVSAEIRFWFLLFNGPCSARQYLRLASLVLCEATKWVMVLNWLNIVLKANPLLRKVQSSLKDSSGLDIQPHVKGLSLCVELLGVYLKYEKSQEKTRNTVISCSLNLVSVLWKTVLLRKAKSVL